MSEHLPIDLRERTALGEPARRAVMLAVLVGLTGLAVAVIAALAGGGVRRFWFAYLLGFLFSLTLSLGALAFVLLQHVSRAGWSAAIRRIPEAMAAALGPMAVLAAPIFIAVIFGHGQLYPWAGHHDAPAAHVADAGHTAGTPQVEGTPQATGTPQTADAPHAAGTPRAADTPHAAGNAAPAGGHATTGGHDAAHEALIARKRPYLNIPFFAIRLALYLTIWAIAGTWYWRTSLRQDVSRDAGLTARMQARSPIFIILFALTVTFAGFDLVMSLAPAWYSTIFGVYIFAGCMVGGIAAMILILAALQRGGFLGYTITPEHYHDLGKLLFAFTFFWGYIAFSQYMLIWYGNIPEETAWFVTRGATTVPGDMNGWTAVSLVLLFGHLLIPFAGLLGRRAKRRLTVLVFWAAWMLVFHWLDLVWLIMPEYLRGHVSIGPAEIAATVGVGGLWVAGVVRLLSAGGLVPLGDPRLGEALAFENA